MLRQFGHLIAISKWKTIPGEAEKERRAGGYLSDRHLEARVLSEALIFHYLSRPSETERQSIGEGDES